MKTKLAFFFLLLLTATASHSEKIIVGGFSGNNLHGWQEKEFEGKTSYTLIQEDELIVLKASSSNSASGLFKEMDIDLNNTPVIHWSWKVKNTLNSKNERVKSGDDFAARIYVVFSDGPFFWQTKTLNYVWANQAKAEEHWPNPFTSNAQMLAIKSGDETTGVWHTESRNVLEDIQKTFGKNITQIEAIAIMTDTDQTGAATEAWFGDIWFSAKP
ncbi:MAG: hypothetical protein A6F70_00510 [Cycloclasticus sp. symbiont of Bathymodiolus heckerae]|nr:MAG: hypothetical protein A6F70_00510 [Cycloclasticus sp. symbiont of Bathymodiolus heckerae]